MVAVVSLSAAVLFLLVKICFSEGNGVILQPMDERSICPGETIQYGCVLPPVNTVSWIVQCASPGRPCGFDGILAHFTVLQNRTRNATVCGNVSIFLSGLESLPSQARSNITFHIHHSPQASKLCLQCEGVLSTIFSVTGPNISSPNNLTSRITNGTDVSGGVEVYLSWSPPSDTPDDVQYHIKIIANSSFIVQNEITTSPCFNVTLQLNEMYQVSISASVCDNMFVSDPLETDLTINTDCILPPNISVVILTVREGPMLVYQCAEGYMPEEWMESWCINGQWTPDPVLLSCSKEPSAITTAVSTSVSSSTSTSAVACYCSSTAGSEAGPSVDYLVRLNTAAVIGLVVGVLVVMVLVYTCGLLTGSLVQRQRGGAGKCPPTSAPTSPAAPDTAAVQLPPVYEQVLPPATTTTRIPLEENVAYARV